jgi:recombinational DNA repair protein RecT
MTMQPEKNTGLAVAEPKSTALAIKGWMSAPSMQQALGAALAGYMSAETFAAQCYLAAQDVNLRDCSKESLFRAFLECAQMGLLPGTHHRHVALVPRGGLVTVTPQWQGFKFLMERQPGIKRVRAVLVHRLDKFSLVDGEVRHEYDPLDERRVFEHPVTAKGNKRECDLVGGYLVIEREGAERPEYHFVRASKIHRNRECAQTQTIWTKWFEEMALKTIYRDAWSKRVISVDPALAQRLGLADEADNRAMGNDPSRGAPAQGTRTEQLAARLAAGAPAASTDAQLPELASGPEVIEGTAEEHAAAQPEPVLAVPEPAEPATEAPAVALENASEAELFEQHKARQQRARQGK